MGDLSLSQ